MARSFLLFAVALALSAAPLAAQPTPAPAAGNPAPSPGDGPRARGHDGAKSDRPPAGPRGGEWGGPGGGERRGKGDEDRRGRFEHFKRKLEEMSPEERARFTENFKRWKEMASADREEWKKKVAEEKVRMEKTIDDAIAKAGLQLTKDEREVFVLRYRQERRKIEEQLRKEVEALRDQKLDGMIDRLKAEFGKPDAAAAPTPVSP